MNHKTSKHFRHIVTLKIICPSLPRRVFRWGSTYNLYSFLKVWVAYDGNFVEVVPAPSTKGQHCGICGNYNRQQSDEMTGKDMQKVGSVAELVKDWEWKC